VVLNSKRRGQSRTAFGVLDRLTQECLANRKLVAIDGNARELSQHAGSKLIVGEGSQKLLRRSNGIDILAGRGPRPEAG
jgi:hypothetical protein